MSQHKNHEHHIRPYKIAAQSVGLAACIFIIIFIAGTGIPAILKNDETGWIPFIPFIILPITGYIISWYKELIGTLLMACGGIILLFFFNMEGDIKLGLIYGLPFLVAAVIFFVHINKRSQLKRNEEKHML